MIFDKKNYKIFWSFSQLGNIWRFIFGGNKYIIGETRDTSNKKLFFFTLDYNTGEVFLKNITFENSNYWISIEGATENLFFIGRFEKPELPNQIDIIAIDIKTGKKIWENKDYSYLINTDKQLFGIKRKFESNEIAEIDIRSGAVIRVLNENEHSDVYYLKNRNDDIMSENSNYPVIYNRNDAEENIIKIFDEFNTKYKNARNFEYIKNGSLLIFNFYIKFTSSTETNKKEFFENKFVIYNMKKSEILFEDELNKETVYCVPDNFFIKNDFLFYLKEKSFLNCIKLNSV